MRQHKGPPRPGGPEAGRNTEHPNHTACSDDFKTAVEPERQLLALGWLQPIELYDIAKRIGLRSHDFTWVGYGFLFKYIADCGERGVPPTVDECVLIAAQRYVEVDTESLFDLLLNTDFQDGELVNYAFDVQRTSQDRASEFFRELCRDTIRAINRGLAIDAEYRRRRRRKTGMVGDGLDHRHNGRKVVCCG